MSTLSNRSLDASYIELLKIDPTGGVNTGISASLANVETGNGTASALQLSTARVHSTGTLTSAGLATLNSAAVTNNATIGGTLGVTGLLTATGGVSGALTGSVTGNVAGDVTGNVNGNLSGNVNGTIGATTPNSGSFTTLGASGSSTFSSVSATSLTVSGDASFTGSGAIKMPVGATAGATGRPVSPAQGMLRYNTSLNQFEGYDGSSWAPIASGSGGGGGGGQTMYVRQTFTATASQTTFTITGGYTAYKLDVFQNGVKLVNSDVGISRDVDVSNGTTIVLATGAAVGDVIDVIGLTSGNFAGPATARRQTYTATAGQTTFTVSGGYTVGQLDVFQNGTKLVTAVDVDVSNGSTFTLTTPAVAGDSLEVVGFTAADTVSGTLQFQAGTAAAPSITTFGDTNTGIFFPAADTIAFSEGGVEAMRINSSGNVGIGATSFGVYRLNIAGDSAAVGVGIVLNDTNASGRLHSIRSDAGTLAIYDGTAGADRLRIDSSGRVGVGVASPAVKLDVSGGDIRGKEILLENGAASSPALGTTPSWYSPASGVAALSTNANERLRIDSSGIVGIGTNSPSGYGSTGNTKLVVTSSARADAWFVGGSGHGAYAYFSNNAQKTPTNAFQIGQGYSSGSDNAGFLLVKDSSPLIFGTGDTERMRISSSGLVKIGTTTELLSSANILEVSGTQGIGIKATGGAGAPCMLAWNSAASGNNTFAIFYTEASPSSVGSIDFNRASTLTRYNTTSDATLKNIIGDSSGEESVSILKNTKIRDYTWKKDITNKVNVGVVAQELYEVFKGAVSVGGDIVSKDSEGNDITTYRPWGVDKTAFTFHLVAGWKAHEKLIQDLKTENDTLKSRIEALEAA